MQQQPAATFPVVRVRSFFRYSPELAVAIGSTESLLLLQILFLLSKSPERMFGTPSISKPVREWVEDLEGTVSRGSIQRALENLAAAGYITLHPDGRRRHITVDIDRVAELPGISIVWRSDSSARIVHLDEVNVTAPGTVPGWDNRRVAGAPSGSIVPRWDNQALDDSECPTVGQSMSQGGTKTIYEKKEEEVREREGACAHEARGPEPAAPEIESGQSIWPSHTIPAYHAYVRYFGLQPTAVFRLVIEQLLQPDGHPSGARLPDSERAYAGKVFNGFTVEQIARAIEDMALSKHNSPAALIKHVAGLMDVNRGRSNGSITHKGTSNGTALTTSAGSNTGRTLPTQLQRALYTPDPDYIRERRRRDAAEFDSVGRRSQSPQADAA